MVRQGHLKAVVGIFLIGCAVLLVIGCAGARSGAPQEKQRRTEAPHKEQARSPQATASEEARCEGTRKINVNMPVRYTTNDIPGCPKGGLLLGTDKADELAGEKGDDEIRGLGGSNDTLWGGDGNDVIYGGPGNDNSVTGDDGDDVIYGGPGNDKNVIGNGGDDVIYGGPGDDNLSGRGGKDVIYGGPGDDTGLDGLSFDEQRDEIYCGEGRDSYFADKADYVDSSCEKKLPKAAQRPAPLPLCTKPFAGDVCRMPSRTSSASASTSSVPQMLADGGGPAILPPAAALLFGSGILTYAILRRM